MTIERSHLTLQAFCYICGFRHGRPHDTTPASPTITLSLWTLSSGSNLSDGCPWRNQNGMGWVEFGVSQGSFLGLILYLFYTVDIPSLFIKHLATGHPYADDVHIFCSRLSFWGDLSCWIHDSLMIFIRGCQLTVSSSTPLRPNSSSSELSSSYSCLISHFWRHCTLNSHSYLLSVTWVSPLIASSLPWAPHTPDVFLLLSCEAPENHQKIRFHFHLYDHGPSSHL